MLETGGVIEQETRRWDEESGTTIRMRSKADAIDYKYFVEPNLPKYKISEDWLETIKNEIPVLAHERRRKYLSEYMLSTKDANTLIKEKNYGGKKYSVTEYTMSEILASVYQLMEKTGLKEGILFLDEINCVSETLAPMMLQFLQCKTFGNQRLPEGWLIVAAGNPPEYNKSVRDFDIATLDRVKKIDVEADFGVWKEYAKLAEIHPAIISYLTAKPHYFYQVETTVDGKIFATPRGWEDLSRFLEVYERIGLTCDRDVVKQYIQHAKIAKDFANYLELYAKYKKDYGICFEEKIKPNL